MTESDYGTIRIPKDVWKIARDAKQENDEEWADLVLRGAEAEPRARMTEAEVRQIVRDEIESYSR